MHSEYAMHSVKESSPSAKCLQTVLRLQLPFSNICQFHLGRKERGHYENMPIYFTGLTYYIESQRLIQ